MKLQTWYMGVNIFLQWRQGQDTVVLPPLLLISNSCDNGAQWLLLSGYLRPWKNAEMIRNDPEALVYISYSSVSYGLVFKRPWIHCILSRLKDHKHRNVSTVYLIVVASSVFTTPISPTVDISSDFCTRYLPNSNMQTTPMSNDTTWVLWWPVWWASSLCGASATVRATLIAVWLSNFWRQAKYAFLWEKNSCKYRYLRQRFKGGEKQRVLPLCRASLTALCTTAQGC